jgi:hypothetical protein
MTTEEIRLVIPAEEDFRPIVHLVAGGLASRLNVTYDELEDIQVALDAVLALRDDDGDLTVLLGADPGLVRVAVGPFQPSVLPREETSSNLSLARVLGTVCDSHEVEWRDDGAWIEMSKRTASVGAA